MVNLGKLGESVQFREDRRDGRGIYRPVPVLGFPTTGIRASVQVPFRRRLDVDMREM
jgi:hypothetical protein